MTLLLFSTLLFVLPCYAASFRVDGVGFRANLELTAIEACNIRDGVEIAQAIGSEINHPIMRIIVAAVAVQKYIVERNFGYGGVIIHAGGPLSPAPGVIYSADPIGGKADPASYCQTVSRNLPPGLYHWAGSVYSSNGSHYCGFTSPEHFHSILPGQWGRWKDFGSVVPIGIRGMVYDGPCT
ncbi:MAG: hypothetical protein HQK50_09075 [Oligoflexia bacterium]|nr:hypothetical protein [Oligoflexia bacterium]MBF0365711.1 hypothetical protein [Oligoflexia bacterium]